MTRAKYIQSLTLTAIVGGGIALLLWFVLGTEWFGFYGLAIGIAILTAIAGWLMIKRRNYQKQSLWPVLAFVLPVLAAAATQISYWMMFFASPGNGGITLGIVRTMFLENADPFLPWIFAIFAVLGLWLLSRTLAAD